MTELTMSQAPNKDYLQGWNDCHAHLAAEIVRLDERVAGLEKALEDIIANEEAYNRGDALSAHIARETLGGHSLRGLIARLDCERADRLEARVEELEAQRESDQERTEAVRAMHRYRAALERIRDRDVLFDESMSVIAREALEGA